MAAAIEDRANVTYVTALYKIYPNEIAFDRLRKDVVALLDSKLPLIIFVDTVFEVFLKDLGSRNWVKMIVIPIEEIKIWTMIKSKSDLTLPEYRTVEKDTLEYMTLMNAKVEFVKLAQQHSASEYLAWIDAGIAKMFQPKVDFERLRRSKIVDLKTVLIPGCYQQQFEFSELCSGVKWVYAGSFFLINREFLEIFYDRSLIGIQQYLDSNRITWEVNLWCTVGQLYPDTFNWYYSGHDSLITKLPGMYCQKLRFE